MYAFQGDILENNAVVLQYKEGGNDDRGQDAVLNDYIRQLQSCVHMFDQDYVMKVCEHHTGYGFSSFAILSWVLGNYPGYLVIF
jgi:hypothetical protein